MDSILILKLRLTVVRLLLILVLNLFFIFILNLLHILAAVLYPGLIGDFL